MTYSEIVRYATMITGNKNLAKDVTHDYYLYLKTRFNIELLDNDQLPKNYIHRGLKRIFINTTWNHTWFRKDRGIVTIHNIDIHSFPVADRQKDLANQIDSNIFIEKSRRLVEQNANNIARSGSNSPEIFLKVFDMSSQGYTPSDIGKEVGKSRESINWYIKKIRKWIA